MGRPLPSFSVASHFNFLLAPVAFLAIFSILIFLCASDRKSKKSAKNKDLEEITNSESSKDLVKFVAKVNSKISSKAAAMATKMVSWRKVEAAEEDNHLDQEAGQSDEDNHQQEDDQGDEAVWRKKIIMGERCTPLNFSGNISYDSDGNLFSDSTHDYHHHP